MTDENFDDHISGLLQGLASRFESQVTVPELTTVTDRTRRMQRHRIYRNRLFVATVVAVAAVFAIVFIVPSTTPPVHNAQSHHATSPTKPASYPVKVGPVTLVVKDLLTVQKSVPTIPASKVTTLDLPVTSANFSSIAFGDGKVWLIDDMGGQAPTPCGKLEQVDVSTMTVGPSTPLASCPHAVAFGVDSVWVLSYQLGVAGYQLAQINPSTLATISTVTIDRGFVPEGDTIAKYLFVTVDGNDVFAAIVTNGAAQLIEVNASNGTVVRSIPIPVADGPISALDANGHAVWVGTSNGWVLSIDPTTGTIVHSSRLGTRVASLSASNAGVWVTVNLPVPNNSTYPGLDTLRLSPITGAIVNDTGLPMVYVATDGASVWTLSSAPPYSADAGLLSELNSTTGTMTQKVELPVAGFYAPDTLGVYGGSAWIINDFIGTLTRVSP